MKIAVLGRWWETLGRQLTHPVAFAEREMLRDPAAAWRAVAIEIRVAIAGGAAAVCLPGSAVPTDAVDRVPVDVLQASRGATVVLETFVEMQRAGKGDGGAATRRGWVLRDGEVLRGPITQIFFSSGQLKTREDRHKYLGMLAAQWARGIAAGERPVADGRVFPLPGAVGVLLLCGEFNAVYGGRADGVAATLNATTEHEELRRHWDGLAGLPIVAFNPTHTWTTLPPVIGKRAFLASRGAYVAPTNAYAGYGSRRTQRQAGVTQVAHRAPNVMRAPEGAPHGAFVRDEIQIQPVPTRSHSAES